MLPKRAAQAAPINRQTHQGRLYDGPMFFEYQNHLELLSPRRHIYQQTLRINLRTMTCTGVLAAKDHLESVLGSEALESVPLAIHSKQRVLVRGRDSHARGYPPRLEGQIVPIAVLVQN